MDLFQLLENLLAFSVEDRCSSTICKEKIDKICLLYKQEGGIKPLKSVEKSNISEKPKTSEPKNKSPIK